MKAVITHETPDAKNIAAAAIADKKNASPSAAFASRRTVDHNISFGPAGKLIGSFSLLAGLLLAGSASANPATSVSVGGQNYSVTYQSFYNSNTSPFATGSMPWWGSQSLADQFATAVGLSLGTPNSSSTYGPFFAYTYTTVPMLGAGVMVELESNVGVTSAFADELTSYNYAIASLLTSFSSSTLQPYADMQ